MDIDHLKKIFKILSDVNRLRILNLLQKRRMCVCELSYVLGVTQPSVSRHLKKMKSSGILDSEKAGFWTDYFLAVNDPCCRELLKSLKVWLKNDRVAAQDLRKLHTADRKKLCC